MDLSCQLPEYQDIKKDDKDVDDFINKKFPQIQQLAENMNAEIAFEDEAARVRQQNASIHPAPQ